MTSLQCMKRRESIDWLVVGRRVGNIMIPLGYIFLLNVDLFTGIIIRLVANVLVLPWGVRAKMWDFVALISFLMCIELHKLITMFLI